MVDGYADFGCVLVLSSGPTLHLADRYTCRWRDLDYLRGCAHRQREAYAPQVPGAARGPQKLLSPLTESTSVLGSRMRVMGPAGVSIESLVAVTTPVATSPDEEIRCPLATSPPVMTLLEILSQGGGLSVHHL